MQENGSEGAGMGFRKDGVGNGSDGTEMGVTVWE